MENAIFSGIEPGGKNGSIKIRIWQEEEKLCISVKDDGVGMTEEKIQDIMNNPQKRKGDTMSGIACQTWIRESNWSMVMNMGCVLRAR